MDCILLGNYGVGNIGDEALREYFLNMFPDIEWTVVSAKPVGKREVPRLPLGICSFFTSWWRTIAAIRRSHAVVFGGGSLLTDNESIFACVLWWWHGLIPRLCGKPLLLAFQGIGPFRTPLGQLLARATFEHAAFISVRDEESLARVSTWRLKTTPLLTFDPVFKIFAARKRSTSTNKILSIIPRRNSDERFFSAVSGKVTGGFHEIRILLLQPEQERGVAARIVAMSGGKAKIVEIVSVEQLLDEVSASSAVIAQRYHGALAALALGVLLTIIAQTRGDKLDGLCVYERDAGSPSTLLERVEAGEAALRCALRPTGRNRGNRENRGIAVLLRFLRTPRLPRFPL